MIKTSKKNIEGLTSITLESNGSFTLFFKHDDQNTSERFINREIDPVFYNKFKTKINELKDLIIKDLLIEKSPIITYTDVVNSDSKEVIETEDFKMFINTNSD